MPADLCANVDKQLDNLVEHLAAEYADRAPRREVERTVARVRREFGSPPVRDFLPILVERQVRDLLQR